MLFEILNNGGSEKHDNLMLTYYHDFNLFYQQFNVSTTRTILDACRSISYLYIAISGQNINFKILFSKWPPRPS